MQVCLFGSGGVQDLNSKLLDFVVNDIKAAAICESVCTVWHTILKDNQIYQQGLELHLGKKIDGFNMIPKDIVEAFGGVKKLYNYPHFYINKCDELGPSESRSCPIYRGCDDYQEHPFICI